MAMANDRVHPRKRKKVCSFCVDKVAHIDFKDTAKLRRYLSERGKILPRRTWQNKQTGKSLSVGQALFAMR